MEGVSTMSADQTSCETLGKFNDPQGSLSSFLNMLSAELRDYVENVIADIDDDYLLSALKVFYRFPSCKYDWFILPDSEPKGSKHHPPLAEGLLMADWEVLALREAEERHLPIWTEEELDRELFENIPNKHTKKFKKRIKSQPEVSFDEDDFTAELTDNEYREPTIEDLLKEESQTEDPLIIPLENPPENHPVVTDDSPTPQKRKPRAQLSLPASKFGIMRKFLKNESVSS
jgi:hypothetical protein